MRVSNLQMVSNGGSSPKRNGNRRHSSSRSLSNGQETSLEGHGRCDCRLAYPSASSPDAGNELKSATMSFKRLSVEFLARTLQASRSQLQKPLSAMRGRRVRRSDVVTKMFKNEHDQEEPGTGALEYFPVSGWHGVSVRHRQSLLSGVAKR